MIICVTNFEGLIFDDKVVEDLYKNHKVYCKMVGVGKESKNNK